MKSCSDGARPLLFTVLAACGALLAGGRAAGEEGATVRIMPLGDSITESYDGQATYRYFLWHLLVDAGYDVDFVGSNTGVIDGEPLYADFDQDHEGHSGITAGEVALQIEGWVTSAGPDTVLIHLGTNDVAYGEAAETTTGHLGAIIDSIRGHDPRAAILLAQIVPFFSYTTEVQALNQRISVLAAEKDTDESPVVLVNQWTGFSAAEDTFDGVHPNEQGDRKMAGKWFQALVSVLGTAPAITAATADDPDGDGTLSAGDTLTIAFDIDTNQPAAGTKAEIDGLIDFGAKSLGTDYTGVWTDAGTLVTTMVNPTNGDLVAGDTITVIADGTADLRNAAGTSPVSTSSYGVTGSWGASQGSQGVTSCSGGARRAATVPRAAALLVPLTVLAFLRRAPKERARLRPSSAATSDGRAPGRVDDVDRLPVGQTGTTRPGPYRLLISS